MVESAPFPPASVLVVDDHWVVRRLAQLLLSEAGYRTFEAENGAEALDVLNLSRPVDLVLVDVVMPRLNGAELVQEILLRRPDQRVLYMSAYPAELLAMWNAPDLEVPILAKPFTRETLLANVAGTLQRQASPLWHPPMA